jgi:glycerol uptake facilitator protein
MAQLLGAFVAAALLFSIYSPYLQRLETSKGVERGGPGSEITAMCYGEYFPNPGELAAAPGPYDPEAHARLRQLVSHPAAFCVEMLGTMILALVVFAVSDPRNSAAPTGRLAPVFIGLTVAALISILAPLTQACFNPARDFGPRLFAYIAGWGEIAIPGTSSPAFLTVYIVAPTIGALLGGGLYELFLRPYVADESAQST